MKIALRVLVVVVLAVVLLGAGVYGWATMTSNRMISRTYDMHSVDFPVPFPLEPEEVEEMGLSEAEAEELALERAMERGRHLVEARYVCIECHGENFGGGVMVDDPLIGRLLGPNITEGRGGRIAGYTPAAWDLIVRHGLLPDGRPSAMPSEDFARMSDQELSDIIAYVTSQPPVDNEVPPRRLGPLGKLLIATGELELSVNRIASHDGPHPRFPPDAGVTVDFGRHVASVCTGCHGHNLAGGRIAGGDPSWPAASNLTPAGLGSWTYEDFERAMREAVRPGGEALQEPMAGVAPFAQRMTDVELQALWMYLQSLEPVET